MNSRMLVTIARAAGAAGLSLLIFLVLYQGILQKPILPESGLTADQGFLVILAFMLLTFGVVTVGLVRRASASNVPSVLLSLAVLSLVALLAYWYTDRVAPITQVSPDIATSPAEAIHDQPTSPATEENNADAVLDAAAPSAELTTPAASESPGSATVPPIPMVRPVGLALEDMGLEGLLDFIKRSTDAVLLDKAQQLAREMFQDDIVATRDFTKNDLVPAVDTNGNQLGEVEMTNNVHIIDYDPSLNELIIRTDILTKTYPDRSQVDHKSSFSTIYLDRVDDISNSQTGYLFITCRFTGACVKVEKQRGAPCNPELNECIAGQSPERAQISSDDQLSIDILEARLRILVFDIGR